MLLQEMSMQIQFLAREGLKKAAIAQRLGISRQTVYNHLKRDQLFPQPRAPKISKLDAFKGYIRHRLESFDLPATVLHRELVEKGYEGGLTILRTFIRPLKAEFTRQVTERFETRPGQQAQLDWGECGQIEEEGQGKTLYVFVLVLGYSRMLYAHFTTSTKIPVLLGCLQQALGVLGIPREILVDNMKQAVDQHDVHTGTVRWNATFLAFAQHYGFLPVACPPYWPRVKGKVERGVGYIKTSFLEGRTFTDLADLNQQLQGWLDAVANVRVHCMCMVRPAPGRLIGLSRSRRIWRRCRGSPPWTCVRSSLVRWPPTVTSTTRGYPIASIRRRWGRRSRCARTKSASVLLFRCIWVGSVWRATPDVLPVMLG